MKRSRGSFLPMKTRIDCFFSFFAQGNEYSETEDFRDSVLKVFLVENQTHPFAVVRAATGTEYAARTDPDRDPQPAAEPVGNAVRKHSGRGAWANGSGGRAISSRPWEIRPVPHASSYSERACSAAA